MSRVAGDEVVAENPSQRRKRLALMFSVPVLILLGVLYFWLTGGRTVSTDNAQVVTHIVSVSPELNGKIIDVAVRENQRVRKGDLLYRIDSEPYRIALLEAEAAIGGARMQVARMQGDLSSKMASIDTRRSDVLLAEENFRRQKDLLASGFTTRANYDAASAALASARAEQSVASADAQAARAMITGGGAIHPQIEAALAARDKAALDLRRTEVRSPIDGIIAQSDKLSPGVMAVPMLSNVSVVGTDRSWIEANFKETQLAKIRVGQPAEIEIDAIPGRIFHGHVSGIGAGTGSEFSLLPAQNATGNWVKVVQRVAVRIALDGKVDQQLVTGSSASVKVRVAN